MKIILLKDVPKLGHRLDIKDVSSGYATNLLIPKGLAVSATKEMIRKTEIEKAMIEGEKMVQQDLLVKNIQDLEGITITMKSKANEKGHLFAGLHKEAIAEELAKQTKLTIDPTFIQLEHPIKEVGEHTIEVKGIKKIVKFKLVIEA